MNKVRDQAVSRSDRKSIAGKGIHYNTSDTDMGLGCLKTAWNPEPLEQWEKN